MTHTTSLPLRLVEMLPNVPRETLAAVICGNIASRFDCPSSYLRVLNALILHVGWHSNRVWASQTRLARIASTVKEICVKTVQRAIRYFVRTVGLRILANPTERLQGPGEHIYTAAGHPKKGEGPVNHYDLSALGAFIPEALRKQGEHRETGSSFLSKKTSLPLCNVGIKKDEKRQSETARSPKFEKTKLSDVIKRSATPISKPISTVAAGYRALASLGVSVGMRHRIIAARGDSWATEAALYTRLQQERGEILTTPAQYLVAVFRNWETERTAGRSIAWPDWLQSRLERERAATARIVRAAQSGAVTQARRQVSRPITGLTSVLPPSKSPGKLPGLPTASEALSESECSERERAARQALRRSLPGAPTALIERLARRSTRGV